jgi:hypothetical protein
VGRLEGNPFHRVFSGSAGQQSGSPGLVGSLKICLILPFEAISLWPALREFGHCMKEERKLSRKSGSLKKKLRQKGGVQTIIFHYKRGKESTTLTRSKSGP